jgi:hypothetical protein
MIGGVGVGVGVGLGDPMTGVVIVMVYTLDADVPAVAVTVTLKVPEAVGVPLIVPADEMLSPPGSPLAVHVAVPVPPVAARVAL